MYKAKVYFEDEPMEYVVVAGYTETEVIDTLEEEFYDRTIMDYELERISDAPLMTIVSVDAYNVIEAY